MKIPVFHDIILCQLINSYQHFKGILLLLNFGNYLPFNMM
jgi:hypothetical protein